MKITRRIPEGLEVNGPYSQTVEIEENGFSVLYVTGQGTFEQETGKEFLGDINRQAEIAMNNLKTAVEGSGFQMENIVKVTMLLTDASERSKVNAVYKNYFPEGKYPARSTVGAKELPGGKSIEIEAVAYRSTK